MIEAMIHPVRPLRAGSVKRWQFCLDNHELAYIGVTGPSWHLSHSWLCMDLSHDEDPPIYRTRDGSADVFASSMPEQRGMAFHYRRLLLEYRGEVDPKAIPR